MNDIEVGEYVRTNKGIFKIRYVDSNKTINKYSGDNGHERDNEGDRVYSILKTTDIKNHSKNLIDLIEVNDVLGLNGMERIFKVIKIDDERIYGGYETLSKEQMLNDYKITILTHECYERECYKVEG